MISKTVRWSRVGAMAVGFGVLAAATLPPAIGMTATGARSAKASLTTLSTGTAGKVSTGAPAIDGSSVTGLRASPTNSASTSKHTETNNVPSPTVQVASGGIYGVPFTLGCCTFSYAQAGYSLQEYFISGTAKTYTTPSTTANYKTRILVALPLDRAKFNGTVMAEWENVTAQAPAEPDMVWMHHYMMPKGYGYMAVATQQNGVTFLQKWDPVRYGSLSQPGDAYSYDIYSQAIEALLHPKGLDPMNGVHVKRVIGIGQSQSATMLNNYMNLAQNDANVVNGMILQADGPDGVSRKSFPNLRIPLIQFETQDSIISTPPDPKNDPNLYRLWEVVGTDHVGGEDTQDPAAVTFVATDTLGTERLQPLTSYAADNEYWSADLHYGQEGPSVGLTCTGGSEMPVSYALDAALHDMQDFLTEGTPIPQPPRAVFNSSGVLVLDQYGNAEGGLRLPPIMVPAATYKATQCNLLGITVPLSPTTLEQLYPTHADYVADMAAAINQDVSEGIMVPSDGQDLFKMAEASAIPLWPVPPSLPYLTPTLSTLGIPS